MDTEETAVVKQEQSLTVSDVISRVNLVHQVLKEVMIKDTHFGTVPGCGSQMVLFKPGADVLAMTFKLVPQYSIDITKEADGHREYDVTCTMYSASGAIMGQGVGCATTMEKKYRWRKDGNGQQIENPDIADVYNTVKKMAKKRAHVDATLTVTGAADLFTQDLIENEDEEKAPVGMPKEKKEKKAPRKKKEPTTPENDQVQGILESVSEKAGTAKGKDYIRYGITIEGEIYGTFSDTLAETAKELQGEEVILTFEMNGKYKNAVAIDPTEREPGSEG